ncbi:MAG: patatin-like phospholipase family protein [Chloroflexi bacterium]|nr:patatin-like phospholipase family protein [Chloroflexota bacterium]MBU1746414.1 patatin-like phospholipase family protein [Chloroflexota bacterium]
MNKIETGDGGKPRTVLVLAGGGLRGAAHVGIMEILEEVGLLKHVDAVVGTSAGSVVGAMFATGSGPAAIRQSLLSIPPIVNDLIDFNYDQFQGAVCKREAAYVKGLLAGEAFAKWLDTQLKYAHRFTDFATLPSTQRIAAHCHELFIFAVNVEDGQRTVFCDTSHPRFSRPGRDQGLWTETGEYEGYRCCGQVSIASASRCSSSVPGALTPQPCEEGQGGDCPRLRSLPHEQGQPQHYVDGAVREDCPLRAGIEVAQADRVIAIALGYAGERVDVVVDKGVIEVLGQSLSIMGKSQLDADMARTRHEIEAGTRQLSGYVLNPRIFDVDLFEAERMVEVLARGRAAGKWFLDEVERKRQENDEPSIWAVPGERIDVDSFFGFNRLDGIYLYDEPVGMRSVRAMARQFEQEVEQMAEQVQAQATMQDEFLKPIIGYLKKLGWIGVVAFAIGGLLSAVLAFLVPGPLLALLLLPAGGLFWAMLVLLAYLYRARRRVCNSFK